MMDTIKSNQNKHPTTWTNLSIRLSRKPLSIKVLIQCSLIVVSSMWLMGTQADATAPCNVGSGTSSTECGVNAVATADNSTALGAFTDATADSSTAVGVSADATAIHSTAVGVLALATADSSTAVGTFAAAAGSSSTALGSSTSAAGSNSTALGRNASATAFNSTALGRLSSATGFDSTALGASASAAGVSSTALGRNASATGLGSTALGEDADINFASSNAIALGHDAKILDAPDGIAIGSDANNDGIGATSIAEGAIAIGADVVADIPNTLITNVPILAKDVSGVVVPKTMFEIQNSGNTKFNVTNTDANESWAFANPGTGFRLSRQGSGSVEFEVKNNGNAVLAGTLTENSDMNNKEDIQALDQQAILNKVMELPISQWRYKDDPQSKHIGPMAQDFYQAFELGDTDKGISTLDSSGIALAAIQALKQENKSLRAEKDTEIAELKNQNKALTERMQKMEDQLTEIDKLKQQLSSILVKTGGAQLVQVLSE